MAVSGGFDVRVRAVSGVDQRLLGVAAGVGRGLAEHRSVGQHVRGVGGDVGGGDDLVGLVDDGLGVVGLDVGTVTVLHDPRVGVGEVALGLRLGPGLRGGRLARVGRGLRVAGAGTLLAAAFFVLGAVARLGGGPGLDLRAGGLQLRQPLLAPVQLGGQVDILAVGAEGLVLGGVGGLGVGQQCPGPALQGGDLGLDLLFLVDQAAVAHRLVLGGVRLQLGAVQRDTAHPDHAQPHGQVQRLREQTGQRIQVMATEPGDRAEVSEA